MTAPDRLRVVGLMSGTSTDAIDAALVDLFRAPRRAELLYFRTFPHPPELRARILAAAHGEGGSEALCMLHADLGDAFGRAAAELCREAGGALREVHAIGSHGQTVWHAPRASPPATFQIGDPARIARRTGLPVVADFRAADVAAGGQGAPVAPITHHLLFCQDRIQRAVVNIGGIANVTILPAGKGTEAVRALDAGPGNMVIDALMARLSGGREEMDRDGAMAARGTVHAGLLDELLSHPYFTAPAPKSTGRETFGGHYAADVQAKAEALGLSPEDMVATLTALSAHGIARATAELGGADDVLLCGGGARNPVLAAMLAGLLQGSRVAPTDALGVPHGAVEGVVFADLAARHLWGEPGNLPAVTGASEAVVLGALTPPPRAPH
jgi:anhydro-N-acetylmuramic acid kinase